VPAAIDGEDYGPFASLEIPFGIGLSGWVAESRKSGNPFGRAVSAKALLTVNRGLAAVGDLNGEVLASRWLSRVLSPLRSSSY
jgi:hypothetical protein